MLIYPEISRGYYEKSTYKLITFSISNLPHRKERECILVNLDFANDQLVELVELNPYEEGGHTFVSFGIIFFLILTIVML